ncbi:MAG: hypothetical protein JWQ39_2467 [Glaciihabitans sp.]|nr:hypothetical protein [Glaciihabitans sp.]
MLTRQRSRIPRLSRMSKVWSDDIARYLVNPRNCPRCDAKLLRPGYCDNCMADLTTPVAIEVAEASIRAADAISSRQGMIDRLPSYVPAPRPVPAPSVSTATAQSKGATSEGSSSQISVQSVLAVVGAGLFAIAAIVFTFLNPDLTNFATRTSIVGAVTVVFLGGAWLLSRARLQFSAEAVGALGMVFVALDIWALSTKAPGNISGWWFAAAGTFVGVGIMFAVAYFARVRTWLWAAFAGVTLVPAMVGYAFGDQWGTTLGYLAVGLSALGVHELIKRVSSRFDSPLRADRGTATVLQIVAGALVMMQLLLLHSPSPAALILGRSAILAGLAVLALLGARNQLSRFWSAVAGASVIAAIAILPLSVQGNDTLWYLALMPTAAAIGLTLLGAISVLRPVGASASLSRTPLLVGGLAVALFTGLPAVAIGLVQLVALRSHVISSDFGLAASCGIAAAALGSYGLWAVTRRHTVQADPVPADTAQADTVQADTAQADTAQARSSGFDWADGALTIALWLGVFTLITLDDWGGWLPVTQSILGLGIALALCAVQVRVRRVHEASLRTRVALVVAAHLLVVVAGIVAWSSDLLSVVGGAAVVAVIIALAQTVPKALRPVHAGIGFGYALIIFAHALALTHIESIAVLCLTTSFASLVAIAVTLAKRLGAGLWYAILVVTMVPFMIGIISVLFVRSGWTGLSTAVTFALALTLVVTRRPGMSRYIQALAAALLVPALAVVVICLGAQVLAVSASPVTLPIIAVIVAVALPSTPLIGAALVRHGLPETDARYARLWIEISALVTAAVAVVLALVRAAAGYDTTAIVLIIIGLGGAVTAITARRGYAWAIAGASWTGALWCFWALAGISLLEPYILPPAIAAAIIGAISVARRLPGTALYSIGLACAVVPSVLMLAVAGNSAHDNIPWRAIGLLVGSLVLVIIGWAQSRRFQSPVAVRLSALRIPTLAAAVVAAASGAIQAVRFGWSLDPSALNLLMLPALEFSMLAALLAAASGALIGRAPDSPTSFESALGRSRWLFVPAAIYLVVGPIAAVRLDWFSIWTLWTLTAFLLVVMLATAVRARTSPVVLPPVWFLFALAWCTAVAGWSERQLRVEAFSLPLGLALLAVGVIAMRPGARASATGNGVTRWPIGFAGSWRLLTPGILVTFIPSVLATGTDPQTLRAILVISLALIAILIGSLRKLAAPFILGIVVLPIENITVFAVQVGRSIGATPWWITLATAGAVLLVIAATYERRNTGERGVAARLRDLR